MQTYYIRFVGLYYDPVWGPEATPWLRTPLIRVTRNNLRRAVFEWVGNARAPMDMHDFTDTRRGKRIRSWVVQQVTDTERDSLRLSAQFLKPGPDER